MFPPRALATRSPATTIATPTLIQAARKLFTIKWHIGNLTRRYHKWNCRQSCVRLSKCWWWLNAAQFTLIFKRPLISILAHCLVLATPFDNDDNVEYDFEAMTKLKNARICSQSVKCILLRKHFLELDKKVTWWRPPSSISLAWLSVSHRFLLWMDAASTSLPVPSHNSWSQM